ncbi:3-hydroxyacyl-CoA dehydrogenase [Halobacillus litoralis]|uniref:3-hydroxyacyl-CoA dehydrogenase n=1 Tax=Halobacillus litoralis TaxID=45668 RepID=UPI001CD3E6FD|nr:3-hydroxyacyl-CoA dehydrogenase [Halobacillus litoralis]MCA0971270.1 3-hydroxyacyl-CoA dehydrogenase [Halobacillus litoralis]
MKVKGLVAVVTGGASGLGEATAVMLAQLGATVVIADRNREKGQKLADEIGTKACFIETDVTSEHSVTSMLDQVSEQFGSIHVLVNCAGIAIGEKVIGRDNIHQYESFQNVMKVNVMGTFNMIRLAAERMERNDVDEQGERGLIINTSSIAAFDGQIGQAAYSASKGAVAAMTLPLARELARHGIRVMSIAPGLFETPMSEKIPESAREAVGKQTPFPKRLGKPSEFAQLVVSIVENTMLNGEVIRLDGAIRMQPK